MIFKTAYQTTACAGFVMQKTIHALQDAYMDGQLESFRSTELREVQGGSSVVNAVPAFAHPLAFPISRPNAPAAGSGFALAVDVRPFGRWVPEQHRFAVRNDVEYTLATMRGQLNLVWFHEAPELLRDISSLPMQVFASWISENVARRFALDPGEQMRLAILAALYYQSLFVEETEIDESEKIRLAAAVSKVVRVTAKDAMSVLDQIDQYVPGVHVFCQLARAVTGSVRLEGLNVGVLYSILGGTWYGTNAKEMVAVALEHPPTWLGLLLMAGRERTFKNSELAKLVARMTGKDGGRMYESAIQTLLQRAAQ